MLVDYGEAAECCAHHCMTEVHPIAIFECVRLGLEDELSDHAIENVVRSSVRIVGGWCHELVWVPVVLLSRLRTAEQK